MKTFNPIVPWDYEKLFSYQSVDCLGKGLTTTDVDI
jgi:hypothetical protein